MKRITRVVLLGMSMFWLVGCSMSENRNNWVDSKQGAADGMKTDAAGEISSQEVQSKEVQPKDKEDLDAGESKETETEKSKENLVNAEGMTLETRVQVPEGYMRVSVEEGSFAAFLRGYSLKKEGSPVLLYNGREKGNQGAHIAVFRLPIENEDLQQCADSVMRMYAEYFYQTGQYERIAFHFVNGFEADYANWRDGNRIVVNGNDVSWVSSASYDESYENFQEYLRIVFAYSGTLSMETESEEIELTDVQAGDVFLKGGSPGHVVMVVDVCADEKGRKAFLLAQGYMPAQEFHLLKNPLHGEDPWYYEDEVEYPFSTPEYMFPEGSLRRLDY